MFEKIELNKNYYTLTVNNISSFNHQEILTISQDKSVKVNIDIKSLSDLNEFEKIPLSEISNVHVSIKCTHSVYVNLNIAKLTNNCMIKNIDLNDMIITLDFYIMENITEGILKNNLKVINRLIYVTDDIQIHSKNYEILYQTNYILKEYKKIEDKHVAVKSKVKKLNEFINS